METIRTFGVWDYIIFFSTVGISSCIGVFFAIRDRNRNSPMIYFLAGGKSGILSVTLSFVVTFQSSLLVIGTPVEVYLYGMKMMYDSIGIIVAYVLGALILVPVFHPLEITSVYKYFSLRFEGNAVRYLVLFAGVVNNTIYMSSVTFGTCLALEVVMGIPYWATIILYTLVATIYTSIGGIKAVICSDVFQLIMILVGMFALLLKSVIDSGSISDILSVAAERLDMNDFRFDPRIRYQFWNTSFGGFTCYFVLTCTQAGIQRIKATPNVKSARLVYIIAAPLYCLLVLLAAFQGMTLFGYYSIKGCDPLQSGRIDNSSELVPLAVLDLFKNMPGLSGLFIAALSSAALSTLSSCLSSVSAITYDDVIVQKYPNISEKTATFLSKIVVVVYGVIGLAIAFAFSKLSGTLIAITFAFLGCTDGPTSAIFLLSILSRRITGKGIFIGTLCGMVVSFWLLMGQTLTGLEPSGKLPPGPTDKCVSGGMNTIYPKQYQTHLKNISFTPISKLHTIANFEGTSLPIATTAFPSKEGQELSGLENLYAMSFFMFSISGFTVTIVVAAIVSVVTKPPAKIDERCLFSFRRQILPNCTIKGKAGNNVDVETQCSGEHELMTKTV